MSKHTKWKWAAGSLEESRAHARLKAAASEMFELLEEESGSQGCDGAFDETCDMYDVSVLPRDEWCWTCRARDLLDKVRGEK